MRRRPRSKTPALYASSLLALFVGTALTDSINLSQFQQISGFPISCENAYNTPIQGCSQSDFNPADTPCSQSCFDGLQSVSEGISNACNGLSADPSTLIGMFFDGKGTQALCPSVDDGSASGGSAAPAATTIVGATTLPPSVPSVVSDPPSILPAPPSVPSSAAPTTVAAVTTTSAPAAASTQAFELPSSGASASATVRPFTSMAGQSYVSAAVAGTQTSSSQPTSGPGSLGGGAVPFTINSSSDARSLLSPGWSLFASVAGAAGLCAVLAIV